MRSPAPIAAAALLAMTALGLSTAAHAQATYHLPWPAGQSVYVTQDCNDSCCDDHVGHNEYAWDFAVRGSFEVLAPRAGTVVHVKMSSNHGGDAEAVDDANYIVIDHGDGTASVMLHLAYGSLDPSIHCGEFVRAGQHLATTGATGWASGNHLHFQVNRIPPSMNRTCECGPSGMGCGASESHWDLFWSRGDSSTSVPVTFAEWPGASSCADRHDDNVLVSRNVDTREQVVTVDSARTSRFVPLAGNWSMAPGGMGGGYRRADVESGASALVSLAGAVPGPGVYEVWYGLPAAGRNVGASATHIDVVARGAHARVSQSQTGAGGGYHPLPGRFKLTGAAGEGLLFSAEGSSSETLAVDNVVLRRVADVGRAVEGGSCSASAECGGDLVCASGRCARGCEATGCATGLACGGDGMCVAPNSESAEVRMASRRLQPAITASASVAGGMSPVPANAVPVGASSSSAGGGPVPAVEPVVVPVTRGGLGGEGFAPPVRDHGSSAIPSTGGGPLHSLVTFLRDLLFG